MKQFKKGIAVLMILAMLAGLAACGGTANTLATPTATPTVSASASKEPAPSESPSNEPIKLRFFSNLPDRESGQGKLEQTLIDAYLKENTHVTIELETLMDDPYRQKFQTYVASNNLPDIFSVWGQPSFMAAIMEKGYVSELTEDYSSYGFFEGSTTDFSYQGKLYGLPRNQDCTALYINKALFEANGVKVPVTYKDLLEAAKTLRAKGIQPMAINGKEGWILALFLEDLVIKVSGDQKTIYNACNQKTTFAADPDIKKAAELFKELVDAGLFCDSFTSTDYNASKNLFVQEQTAMFYMGAWEVGMASSADNSDHFKQNVDIIDFPIVDGGKGTVGDICAWNGGGYAVSSTSPVKVEATKLLNYMMKSENWAKVGWENGLVVPGQDYTKYFTGKENVLQKAVTDMLLNSTSMSGTSWNDYLPGEWKSNCETLCQEFAAGIISVEEFLSGLDEAAKSL